MEDANAWYGTGSRGLVVPRMGPFAGMQGFDLSGPMSVQPIKARPQA